MTDPADTRLFRALRTACDDMDGVGPACRDAIDMAARTGDPSHMHAARLAIDALDDATRETLLRRAHHAMASDMGAIMDLMSGAPGRQRPN